MVGNTYGYRLVDWITDLFQIREAGFDAVALNIGPDCWQAASVALAYRAASRLNNDLKLFFSLDMTVWPQGGAADAQKLANLINKYVDHPAQFKYQKKPFISTFAGDQYPGSFGRPTVCAGWKYFRSLISTANTTGTYFIPGFFPANGNVSNVIDCVDGLFQWNSAWSLTNDTVTDSSDRDWMEKLGPNKSYMPGVSPTFFTHYNSSTLPKNWVYNAGNNYARRWSQVAVLPSVKFVEVATWNDYGESHYIGPRPQSTQLQPLNTTWANMANHLGWARITKPYIELYKTGFIQQRPSDLIIWEYRQHPKSAIATKDVVARPINADWLTDEIYITSYLSEDAEIQVQIGQDQAIQKFTAKEGLNHFKVPYPENPDGPVQVGMFRTGKNVGGLQKSEVEITSQPETYNFNPIVDQLFHDPAEEVCKSA